MMKNLFSREVGLWAGYAVFAVIQAVAGLTYKDVHASTAFPNEPAGFGVVTDYALSQLPAGNDGPKFQGWGLVFDTCVKLISDSTAPLSPSSVMEQCRPVNTTGGGKLYFDATATAGWTEGFLGFWWKPGNPFDGWLNCHQKLGKFDTAAATGTMWFQMFGCRPGPYSLGIYAVFTASGAFVNNCQLKGISYNWGDCPGPFNIYPNVNQASITLGNWHKVELYFKFGTSPTSNNGLLKVWLDGALQMNYTTMNFPPLGDPFKVLVQTHTWDSGDPTQTNVDHHWWDHIYFSAPGGGGSSDTTPPGVPTSLTVQ